MSKYRGKEKRVGKKWAGAISNPQKAELRFIEGLEITVGKFLDI